MIILRMKVRLGSMVTLYSKYGIGPEKISTFSEALVLPPSDLWKTFASYKGYGFNYPDEQGDRYKMTLPYNSTLDAGKSENRWNKGWRC